MDFSYLEQAGKVALVTGGSRGIGRATALALAGAGADVAISGRKLPDLEQVAEEIRALGRRALAVQAHNREAADIERLAATVLGEFGRVDILVNNAATNPVMAPLLEVEEKTYDQIMTTNVKGYFLLSQLIARKMVEQGAGNIVNVASIGGISPDPGLGIYCVSKAAILMLTKAMAKELGPKGIRVNAVAPGVVQTRFSEALWRNADLMAEELSHTPLKRIAQPDEVARTILYLVSDAALYVTGQAVVMDGGGSL